jgi:hypothetical protein
MTEKSKRRWFQFSLRTLLDFVLIVNRHELAWSESPADKEAKGGSGGH